MKRRVITGLGIAAAVLALALAQPAVALAHGGNDKDVASNYRTRITSLPSDLDGLAVRLTDIDGAIELSWHCTGELIVFGYEDEPYLRFTSAGVETNLHSPATYLNQDRYAHVTEPDIGDPTAEPLWERKSNTPTSSWHDHRTHWMSPIPPGPVDANPDDVAVIFERWEIPLRTPQGPASITGDLTIPPPPITAWLPAIVLLAVPATLGLFGRSRRALAVLIAASGAVAFTVDTTVFVLRPDDTLSNRIWTFADPTVVVISATRLWIHQRRRTEHPPLSMMTAGLVLMLMGGIDRIDALTNSQLFAAGPTWLPRSAVIVSVATGLALLLRFLIFLIPLCLGRPVPPSRDGTGSTTTVRSASTPAHTT